MADEFDVSGAAELLMGMLGNDEGKQQLQGIISMLGGSAPTSEMPGKATGGIDPQSLEMVFRLQSVMSAMNSAESSAQTELLKSLRCFLRPERRLRLDNAVKFLNVGRAIEAIKRLEEV